MWYNNKKLLAYAENSFLSAARYAQSRLKKDNFANETLKTLQASNVSTTNIINKKGEDMDKPNKYSEEQIQVLEGLDPVRKRPGMYIGSTDEKGLHHLAVEIVDNSIDEALAGYCTEIDVTINDDGSLTVADNGRGIPTGIIKKEGLSAVEVVLTKLHAGGKFGGGGYTVSGGLHGVGISVVNALSTELIVEVFQNGNHYKQVYHRGIPEDRLAENTGTVITFTPDP